MGKGGGDVTTTSTSASNLPPWLNAAQANLTGAGFNMNAPFLNTPLYQVAGLNADQMKAMDLTRQMGKTAFTEARPSTSGVNPINAAQVDGRQIQEMMNPFLESVGRSTLGNMRREYQNTDAMMAGRAAAASPFGGSAGAIARGQAARAHGENTGAMVNQLMGQGYDRGTAAAMANAQMRQQADMFNANLGLQQAQAESGLMDAAQRRQLAATGAIGSTGDMQQQQMQRGLDVPWQTLQRLAALTPMSQFNTAGMSQTTQPDNSPSPFSQLLGLAGSIATAPASGGGSLIGSLFGR